MRTPAGVDGCLACELATGARELQRELLDPDQHYVTLWSHTGGKPAHLHWVLQPVGRERPEGLLGPQLQAAMFDAGVAPLPAEVEAISERLRELLREPTPQPLGPAHVPGPTARGK